MQWDCQLLIPGDSEVILPCIFTSQLLAIEITAANYRDTWYKSGYLHSSVDVEGLSFAGRKYTLGFHRQLVEIPYSNYRLSFQPVRYAIDTNINVKQISTFDYSTIIMSNSFVQTLAIGADVPITTAASATNVVISPANAKRTIDGYMENQSNRNMWVSFTGAAATAALPNIKVIPGGNIDVPGGYTGAINAIWEAGATGSVVVHEFSYV